MQWILTETKWKTPSTLSSMLLTWMITDLSSYTRFGMGQFLRDQSQVSWKIIIWRFLEEMHYPSLVYKLNEKSREPLVSFSLIHADFKQDLIHYIWFFKFNFKFKKASTFKLNTLYFLHHLYWFVHKPIYRYNYVLNWHFSWFRYICLYLRRVGGWGQLGWEEGLCRKFSHLWLCLSHILESSSSVF